MEGQEILVYQIYFYWWTFTVLSLNVLHIYTYIHQIIHIEGAWERSKLTVESQGRKQELVPQKLTDFYLDVEPGIHELYIHVTDARSWLR